jgi:hypothetical protein
MAVLHRIENELVTGMDDVVMLKPLLQTLGQPSTAAGIAEAAAREFGSSAFEGVPFAKLSMLFGVIFPSPRAQTVAIPDRPNRRVTP